MSESNDIEVSNEELEVIYRSSDDEDYVDEDVTSTKVQRALPTKQYDLRQKRKQEQPQKRTRSYTDVHLAHNSKKRNMKQAGNDKIEDKSPPVPEASSSKASSAEGKAASKQNVVPPNEIVMTPKEYLKKVHWSQENNWQVKYVKTELIKVNNDDREKKTICYVSSKEEFGKYVKEFQGGATRRIVCLVLLNYMIRILEELDLKGQYDKEVKAKKIGMPILLAQLAYTILLKQGLDVLKPIKV